MSTKKSLITLLILVISISLIFTGCGSGSDTSKGNESTPTPENSSQQTGQSNNKVVTIEFWHTFSDTEDKILNDEIIPEFEKQYPNIKVNATRMPYDGLDQQVISAVAGNATPDVMRMDIVWVPRFAKLGALKSVDDLEGFKEIKDNAFKSPMETNYYNGKYYGIPQDTNTKVSIYDKTLLQQAGLSEVPKTFDELLAAAKKIKAKDKWGIGMGAGTWGISPYFLSLGGKFTDDKYSVATGYLNSDESVQSLQKLLDLYDQGLIGPSVLNGQPDTWGGLKNNNYLMVDDGPWFYSIQGDESKQRTVAGLFPEGPGGSVSVVGGEDLVLFTASKHPDEAWTFMKFMFSEMPQKSLALKSYLIPTNKEVANSAEITSDPILKLYVNQVNTAWARTPSPNWNKIDEALSTAFEQVFRHKATPKQALDQAAKEIDGYLQNN